MNPGDPAQVPDWPDDDFDTIVVVTITPAAAGPSVAFAIDHEQLNHLSDTCPASDTHQMPIEMTSKPR